MHLKLVIGRTRISRWAASVETLEQDTTNRPRTKESVAFGHGSYLSICTGERREDCADVTMMHCTTASKWMVGMKRMEHCDEFQKIIE